jgi:hypothetical protein
VTIETFVPVPSATSEEEIFAFARPRPFSSFAFALRSTEWVQQGPGLLDRRVHLEAVFDLHRSAGLLFP